MSMWRRSRNISWYSAKRLISDDNNSYLTLESDDYLQLVSPLMISQCFVAIECLRGGKENKRIVKTLLVRLIIVRTALNKICIKL